MVQVLIGPGMDLLQTKTGTMFLIRFFQCTKCTYILYTCVKDGKLLNESHHSVLTLLLDESLYSQEVNLAVREIVHGQCSEACFDTVHIYVRILYNDFECNVIHNEV